MQHGGNKIHHATQHIKSLWNTINKLVTLPDNTCTWKLWEALSNPHDQKTSIRFLSKFWRVLCTAITLIEATFSWRKQLYTITALFTGQNVTNMACPETWCLLLHEDSFVFRTKLNKYGMSRNLMSLVAQRQFCFQDKTKQIWHIQKLDVSCCKMTALFLGQNLINMACPETWCFLLHN